MGEGASLSGQHRLGGSKVEGALTEGREDRVLGFGVRSVVTETARAIVDGTALVCLLRIIEPPTCHR